MSEPQVRSYLRSVPRAADGDRMPAHYPTCFGCGPDAEQGLHLEVYRQGDEVVAEHVFASRHSGAPGIAHGGVVAAVVDDVLGHLLHVLRTPAVTRHLEVEYRRPVLIGTSYAVRGKVDGRDGRKIWLSCEGRDPDGGLAFSAKALFLQVDLSHFAVGASADGEEPVAP